MIIFAAYRQWAINACSRFSAGNYIATTNSDLLFLINEHARSIDAIVFVGWSEIINASIIDEFVCVCYHPSDLPKYRGGSPLQHQIMDGVIETVGTLFKMDKGIDTGPVFSKINLSLEGDMDAILLNLEKNAGLLIENFLSCLSSKRELKFSEQDEMYATTFKRRKPEMSEITHEELMTCNGIDLYNKIRSLGDPYPNAFIRTVDGRKLLLKAVELI